MEKLIVVRTIEQLKELEAYLQDKELAAVDTETTGVDKESEIIGVSVSAEVDVGYYIILSEWDVESQTLKYLDTKNGIKSLLLLLKSKDLIMHNAIFDCSMIENNFGISLIDSVHTDTMILAHLTDENRSCGLKDLGLSIYGEAAVQEQKEMKESIHKNGGTITKDKYELYKADSELIARYGAKDAILTLKIFWHLADDLIEQGLVDFFYKDECMPLLRGPTYDLNTTGLKVDPERLQTLKNTLESDIMKAKAFVYEQIDGYVKEQYPGTSKTSTFNIGSNKQLSWLLFDKLENDFHLLTKEGKELCKALGLRLPYAPKDKREFIRSCISNKGRVWSQGAFNFKTKKIGRPKKVGDYWNYLSCDSTLLKKFADKYKWVKSLLELKKNEKLLSTYVEGIQSRMKYGVIRPSFLQHGTTSGRYSSRNPNFQNLPRDDKRVKHCIVARPGMVFVGADQAQLEPRVFASVSQDETLMGCFRKGEDFYSVVGAPIYGKEECSLFKDESDSFAKKYPKLRDNSKVIALATPYGRTASQQASVMGITREESQELIDKYFEMYPKVQEMMLDSHKEAKQNGVVYNLYGRPRRIPEAKKIPLFIPHDKLEYVQRTLLNLAMNHKVQSTAASIMNRAAIYCKNKIKELGWKQVKIVMQIHDEIILEGPEALAKDMQLVLKDSMENAVKLPGVDLIAEPKIAKDLAGLK